MTKYLAVLPHTRYQSGIGLVGAIVVMVLLAGLSAAVLTLSRQQQATSTLDVLQSRALLAARSGLEWGLLRWRTAGGGCATVTGNVRFPAGTTLTPFTVTVTCVQFPAGNTAILRVTANACNVAAGACPVAGVPPTADYVERELYADIPAVP